MIIFQSFFIFLIIMMGVYTYEVYKPISFVFFIYALVLLNKIII
jgi:hypothetical protein